MNLTDNNLEISNKNCSVVIVKATLIVKIICYLNSPSVNMNKIWLHPRWKKISPVDVVPDCFRSLKWHFCHVITSRSC